MYYGIINCHSSSKKRGLNVPTYKQQFNLTSELAADWLRNCNLISAAIYNKIVSVNK